MPLGPSLRSSSRNRKEHSWSIDQPWPPASPGRRFHRPGLWYPRQHLLRQNPLPGSRFGSRRRFPRAPPNGWRSASSPAPTRSPGPPRHLRNFKLEHGHLSVGLKIHCLGDGTNHTTCEGRNLMHPQGRPSFDRSGRSALASGAAGSLSRATRSCGSFMFLIRYSNSPSPTLKAFKTPRSALLAIGFYLGSALLAATRPTSLTGKTAIWRTQARPRRTVLRRS